MQSSKLLLCIVALLTAQFTTSVAYGSEGDDVSLSVTPRRKMLQAARGCALPFTGIFRPTTPGRVMNGGPPISSTVVANSVMCQRLCVRNCACLYLQWTAQGVAPNGTCTLFRRGRIVRTTGRSFAASRDFAASGRTFQALWATGVRAFTVNISLGDTVRFVIGNAEDYSLLPPRNYFIPFSNAGAYPNIISGRPGFQILHTFRQTGSFVFQDFIQDGVQGTINVAFPSSPGQPIPTPVPSPRRPSTTNMTRPPGRVTDVNWTVTTFNQVYEIYVGDTVRWTWTDKEPHALIANPPLENFEGPGVGPQGIVAFEFFPFFHTFTRAGTWFFVCPVHPQMNVTIIVKSRIYGVSWSSAPSSTTLNIYVGDTVRWTFADARARSISNPSNYPFLTGPGTNLAFVASAGFTYEHTFNRIDGPGTYDFIDSSNSAVRLTVNVQKPFIVPNCLFNNTPATDPQPARPVSQELRTCYITGIDRFLAATNDALVAPLVRSVFHDCVVGKCDGSLVLNELERSNANNENIPELATLQPLRKALFDSCATWISWADVIVLGAVVGVKRLGGPDQTQTIRLGRGDSTRAEPASFLPGPTLSSASLVNVIRLAFSSSDTDSITMLVALSGAHTLGKAPCAQFSGRKQRRDGLKFAPTIESRMLQTCPLVLERGGIKPICIKVDLDINTPNRFDNQYFKNLLSGEGVLSSDQVLLDKPFCSGRNRTFCTDTLVRKYAADQNAFFEAWMTSFARLANRGLPR